jgi:hypothetical protein
VFALDARRPLFFGVSLLAKIVKSLSDGFRMMLSFVGNHHLNGIGEVVMKNQSLKRYVLLFLVLAVLPL